MPTNPMNITPPIPEVTTGPSWANQINDILTDNIAEHDHTSGKGPQITPAGMNINTDLSLQNNNLIAGRSVRFQNQASSSVNEVADIGCLYESAGDLVYVDGNGVQIPITANGQINVASVGGINGLPYGTAQVGFNVDTYTFKKSSTGYALMDHGATKIRSSDEVSPAYGATIKVPTGMAANYDLTLPIAVPAAQSFLVMGTNGTLNTSIPTANGITRANLAAVGQLVVGPITATGLTAVGWTDVPSFTGVLTTTGRPVVLSLQSTPNVSSTGFDTMAIGGSHSTSAVTSYMAFNIDGSKYSPYQFDNVFGQSSFISTNQISTIVLLGAGSHTIKIQYNKNTMTSMYFSKCWLVAYEL